MFCSKYLEDCILFFLWMECVIHGHFWHKIVNKDAAILGILHFWKVKCSKIPDSTVQLSCAVELLLQLGIMDDALQTHDVLTGHIRRFCFASTCVGEKMNGKCNFRKDFIQFVQHYPSTSARQLYDRFTIPLRLNGYDSISWRRRTAVVFSVSKNSSNRSVILAKLRRRSWDILDSIYVAQL